MKLNDNEKLVYAALKKDGKPHGIQEMAKILFPNADKGGKNKDGSRKKDSWVRNSIRRLVFHGVARWVKRGAYEWTGKKPEDVTDGKMPSTFSMTTVKDSGLVARTFAEKKVEKKVERKPKKAAAPSESSETSGTASAG
jgi:hypothetical protein